MAITNGHFGRVLGQRVAVAFPGRFREFGGFVCGAVEVVVMVVLFWRWLADLVREREVRHEKMLREE
jgi:hypothetical protein